MSFTLKLVSYKQHGVSKALVFFLVQSAGLCLLIGTFSPLTFKVILDESSESESRSVVSDSL